MKQIITILILSILIACSREIDSRSSATYVPIDEDPKLSVETMTVSKGKLIPYIEVSGRVQGIKEIWIVSQAQGIIEESNVKLGQKLEIGETIVLLDSEIQRLDMELTKQNYNTSKLDYEANSKLYKQGSISRTQLDKFKYNFILNRNQYEIAKNRFENTNIKSPIDGYISLLDDSIEVGEYMNQGVKVARIVDNSSYKIKLNLGESQILLIRHGALAKVKVNNTSYIGKVTEIGAGNDISTGSFPIVVEWETNNENLITGISASVDIETKDILRHIIIPTDVVIIKDKKHAVYIAEDGKAVLTYITLGDSLGDYSTVINGLTTDDEIITTGVDSLTDNALIIPDNIGSTGDVK